MDCVAIDERGAFHIAHVHQDRGDVLYTRNVSGVWQTSTIEAGMGPLVRLDERSTPGFARLALAPVLGTEAITPLIVYDHGASDGVTRASCWPRLQGPAARRRLGVRRVRVERRRACVRFDSRMSRRATGHNGEEKESASHAIHRQTLPERRGEVKAHLGAPRSSIRSSRQWFVFKTPAERPLTPIAKA